MFPFTRAGCYGCTGYHISARSGLRLHPLIASGAYLSCDHALSVTLIPSLCTLQSVVCSQSQVAFGRLPLAWLPTCFLEEAAALQLTHLSRHVMSAAASAGEVASRAPNVPPPPPSSPAGVQRALETFMQNAAAQLVNHLCCFAQNRSRGKRRLAKTYEEWVKLTEEVSEEMRSGFGQ